jgi:ABC-type Zn uptake system ZnuABC Zn-binding protein ZnuA
VRDAASEVPSDVAGEAAGAESHHARRRGAGVIAAIGVLAALVALALAACRDGGSAEQRAGDGASARPRVVATTAILREFAEQVAGDDAIVTGMIPPGVDLHSFQPSTRVAREIAEADLLIVNGYNAEGGLLEIVLENRASEALIIVAAAGLPVLDGERASERNGAGAIPADASELGAAKGDPHLWLDAANAIRYVENIRDGLVAIDPQRRAGYELRAAAFIERLRALDAELRETVARIPAERRQLVVFHDAFRYFAAAYGLELVAAVLPSSAGQEPSAADVAAIVEAVREAAVPAVYAEPQFDAGVLELVAEESGARVLTLYSGAFDAGGRGAPDAPAVDGYEAMMRANAAALLDGLGGQ